MGFMKIYRARSTEEYVNMLEQAMDEAWDLRQAIEFDDEYMEQTRSFIDELEAGLKALHESMKDGSYKFATGDLFFMEIMERYHESMIPFRYLLLRINETHMKGIDV
jgi:hypothetical protein